MHSNAINGVNGGISCRGTSSIWPGRGLGFKMMWLTMANTIPADSDDINDNDDDDGDHNHDDDDNDDGDGDDKRC